VVERATSSKSPRRLGQNIVHRVRPHCGRHRRFVANQPMVLAGVLSAVDASRKAARFSFCDAFNIPI